MRELSEDERRESLIDNWASHALSGFVPTDEDRRLAALYISGEMTIDQILAETRARFAHLTEEPSAGMQHRP